jgi:hypothetical protein
MRSFVYDGDWKRAMPSKPPSSKLKVTKKDEATFSEVAKLIAASKEKAFQAVNTTLIDLYWNIGATISKKIETAEWGDGLWSGWLSSSHERSQGCVDSLAGICSECGSSTRPIAKTQL